MKHPWKTGKTIKIVKPNTPGSVRIIHFSGVDIDILLSEGLKNRNKLAKDGKIEKTLHDNLLSDHDDNIFFRAPYIASDDLKIAYNSSITDGQNRMIELLEKTSWVAIDVDPFNTYVFNSELRMCEDNRKCIYKNQAITLAEWLTYCKEAEEMKKNLSDHTKEVQFIFSSGKPVIRNKLATTFFSPKLDDFLFSGLWEIILPQEILEPVNFSYTSKQYQLEHSQNISSDKRTHIKPNNTLIKTEYKKQSKRTSQSQFIGCNIL